MLGCVGRICGKRKEKMSNMMRRGRCFTCFDSVLIGSSVVVVVFSFPKMENWPLRAEVRHRALLLAVRGDLPADVVSSTVAIQEEPVQQPVHMSLHISPLCPEGHGAIPPPPSEVTSSAPFHKGVGSAMQRYSTEIRRLRPSIRKELMQALKSSATAELLKGWYWCMYLKLLAIPSREAEPARSTLALTVSSEDEASQLLTDVFLGVTGGADSMSSSHMQVLCDKFFITTKAQTCDALLESITRSSDGSMSCNDFLRWLSVRKLCDTPVQTLFRDLEEMKMKCPVLFRQVLSPFRLSLEVRDAISILFCQIISWAITSAMMQCCVIAKESELRCSVERETTLHFTGMAVVSAGLSPPSPPVMPPTQAVVSSASDAIDNTIREELIAIRSHHSLGVTSGFVKTTNAPNVPEPDPLPHHTDLYRSLTSLISGQSAYASLTPRPPQKRRLNGAFLAPRVGPRATRPISASARLRALASEIARQPLAKLAEGSPTKMGGADRLKHVHRIDASEPDGPDATVYRAVSLVDSGATVRTVAKQARRLHAQHDQEREWSVYRLDQCVSQFLAMFKEHRRKHPALGLNNDDGWIERKDRTEHLNEDFEKIMMHPHFTFLKEGRREQILRCATILGTSVRSLRREQRYLDFRSALTQSSKGQQWDVDSGRSK